MSTLKTERIELEINSAEQTDDIEYKQTEIKDTESSSFDIKTVDNKLLWKVLHDTQCPLMPDKYDVDGKLSEAYYFNDEFWRYNKEKDEIEMINFKDNKEGKLKRKAKDDAELIFAVDKYTSYVRINKSIEIYDKLRTALAESQGKDDGDDTNDANKKLIPTFTARIMFLTIFITTILNGYFIVQSIIIAIDGKYNTEFMNITALVMAICEAILYSNILFGYIITFFISLLYQLWIGKGTVYVQSKVIALQLRNLSTLSILRYMPSIEIISSWIIHWKEQIAKIYSELIILCSKSLTMSKRRTICDVIFAIPCYIIETIAPLLAIYAILVKIKQLAFVVDGEPFADWSLNQYISFIAFLNQVAGLRVLRNVETASIQHFVFSGSDAELDTDELLLLDDWWNVSLLSAVSNLHLGWYDNMVFWYGLDPQKIQLLLKNHCAPSDADHLLKMVQANDNILTDYDKMVINKLNTYKKNN